jgi:hypothetical protein
MRSAQELFRPAEQVLDGLGISGRRIFVEIGVPEASTARWRRAR